MSWSKIPMTLRIAALMMLGLAGFVIAGHWITSYATSERYYLARAAAAFAAKVFAVYGALELAGVLRDRAALGARLAAAGWASTVAITLADGVISMNDTWAESLGTTLQWVWWVAMLAIGAGFVIAALRRPILAIGGGVLWFAINRPPVLDTWLLKQLRDHGDARFAIVCAQLVLQAVIVLVLASIAVRDVPDGFVIRDPQRIRWGLSRIANALWLRLLAIALVPLATFLLFGGHDGDSSAERYATIAAGFVTLIAFIAFGLGALDAARSNHPDLRRTPFYAAAAGSLWCAGVTLHQLPELYRVLFADRGSYLGERAQTIAGAFPIVIALVAAVTIVAFTIGVEGLAIRRERIDLSERAHRTAIWFVLLSAANVAILQWLLPEARDDGTGMLVLLLAFVCGVVALVSAAKLAHDAAELGNVDQTTIPTATML